MLERQIVRGFVTRLPRVTSTLVLVYTWTAPVLGLFLAFGCMEAPKPKRAEKSAASVASVAPPRPLVAHRVQSRAAPDPPLEPAEAKLDPALVPVEEDFREEVAGRIDKRTNLELELQRVARDIEKRQ